MEETAGACPRCGAAVPIRFGRGPARTYCSSICAERVKYERKQAKKIAAKPTLACPACGTQFVQTRRDKVCCTRRCTDIHRGMVRAEPFPRAICALPECGVEYQPRKPDQRCCREAHSKKLWHREHPGRPWTDARRDLHQRRRAIRKGATTGRPVRLAEIREWDGNRCHLCGKRVGVKPYPHPLSASLDHVIPLSLGGTHDPDNVRLSHLRCNVAKGNGGGNEQLLLIG